MIRASAEALRIVRSIDASFPTGPAKSGTAFVAPAQGKLMTCAHVVVNDSGQRANRVVVKRPDGTTYQTQVANVAGQVDLATIEAQEQAEPSTGADALPSVGQTIIFAGLPQGVARLSVFPGMVSAVGPNLITTPRCDLVQIAGMINIGNSGGPLLDADGNVLGVVTAKSVPLLVEIDKLRRDLGAIPQFPRDVALGNVDFSAFVNLTIRSMWQIAAVLRLVQVGTGWAVPTKYFNQAGGR